MSAEQVRFTGIDPGIIDTGIVTLSFFPRWKQWSVDFSVISGLDPQKIAAEAHRYGSGTPTFIEAYRTRSNLQYDNKMVAEIAKIKAAIPGSIVLNNTGVKKVVRQPLMTMLNVWKFPISTHHDDLRSAARIGLYGALKDEDLNAVLTQFVSDNTSGDEWTRL